MQHFESWTDTSPPPLPCTLQKTKDNKKVIQGLDESVIPVMTGVLYLLLKLYSFQFHILT